MLERIKLAWQAYKTGLYPNFNNIVEANKTRIEYLEEKSSMLEKENFALINSLKLLQDTLAFERSRSKENETIYLKRLGIIAVERSVAANIPFKQINRRETVRDAQMRLQREHESPELKAQREHWEKKIKETEVQQ